MEYFTIWNHIFRNDPIEIAITPAPIHRRIVSGKIKSMTIPTNVPREIFEYAEQGNQFWICFSISFTVFDPLCAECFY
ncbi:hypothetical protein IQB76_01875 [Leptospira borgpetersenii serovar Hardjo-bovis]|nr:hypothetical protein B9T54_13695 [Leptospira borgpetersenii serovar Hardjo-bovis]TQE54925.1 hypothetical protein FFZ95_02190 [Leptospira borgpetersenii]AYR09371.1 hypothetical protein D1609_13850 [Leptospira borgpetersenii serovar Hardjo-bovis]MBE8349515.1 hypothetical protein [Leptospira borgpetersenii serovar Hardjo-bovis]MBE8359928.1 hypothetical protein [Leptospira borgpetersenii serovar Hardjo-bovis]